MTLRDFIDDISEDQFISLRIGEYDGFGIVYPFKKCRVNRSSKILDCKVQSIGSSSLNEKIIIKVYIKCKDFNDIKNFFKKDWLCMSLW